MRVVVRQGFYCNVNTLNYIQSVSVACLHCVLTNLASSCAHPSSLNKWPFKNRTLFQALSFMEIVVMTTVSIPGTVKDEKEIAEKAYFDALINSGKLSKYSISKV